MAHLYPAGSPASTQRRGVARLVALAVLASAAVSAANAQQTGSEGAGEADRREGTEWGLGLGVISKQDAYKGVKRDTMAVPVLRFENEYVEFFGLGLEVKLPSLRLGPRNRIKFGLVAKADLGGYEAKDSPFLAGMAERKGGLWAGAKAEWENEFVDVGAELTGDASGHSKGRQFSLGLKKQWRLGQHTMVMPYVTAHRLDKKYVDYYYGVRDAEVTAGRAAYAGKGGVNLEIGMRTFYRFDEHHSVLLDVGITRLAKEIKASPLVDRSRTTKVILGYVYNF
ncbi:MAG: MipA/OmpV family protein [Oxalobacteraceae bacterium]|nr:MAG: MipA/OmpV family protein [Oxalobacteraceae bacterium]